MSFKLAAGAEEGTDGMSLDVSDSIGEREINNINTLNITNIKKSTSENSKQKNLLKFWSVIYVLISTKFTKFTISTKFRNYVLISTKFTFTSVKKYVKLATHGIF